MTTFATTSVQYIPDNILYKVRFIWIVIWSDQIVWLRLNKGKQTWVQHQRLLPSWIWLPTQKVDFTLKLSEITLSFSPSLSFPLSVSYDRTTYIYMWWWWWWWWILCCFLYKFCVLIMISNKVERAVSSCVYFLLQCLDWWLYSGFIKHFSADAFLCYSHFNYSYNFINLSIAYRLCFLKIQLASIMLPL